MSNFKKISNNPTSRSHVSYAYAFLDNAFDNKELEFIEKHMAKSPLSDAKYFDDKKLEYVSDSGENTPRKSKISFHRPDEKTNWIFERINNTIETINEQFFNYDLNGYESIQYSEYNSNELGRYDFHMDMHLSDIINLENLNTRKLSIGMLLNEPGVDFDGGDFMINTSREKNSHKLEMKKGRLVFFPSFMLHTVTPVTRGIRKSLVVWVTGPKFI